MILFFKSGVEACLEIKKGSLLFCDYPNSPAIIPSFLRLKFLAEHTTGTT